jgi:hypothetical protein
MVRIRPPRSTNRWIRPSPQFERFLTSSRATLVAVLLTVGAVAAAVVAIWREHWIDAVVYAVLAGVCAGWLVLRVRRRSGGPPHPAR